MYGTVSTTAAVKQKSASWMSPRPQPNSSASGLVNGPIELNGSGEAPNAVPSAAANSTAPPRRNSETSGFMRSPSMARQAGLYWS